MKPIAFSSQTTRFFSNFLSRKVLPLAFGTAVLVGLSACGEKRSVQCQKVGAILNATSSQRLSASGTSDSFSRGAALSRQAATDLEALELGDKGLSNLRSHLVLTFRNMTQDSQSMDSIANGEGYVTTDASTSSENLAVIDAFEASGREYSKMFNAVQTYCNGGKVDSALTDSPAS
ncbi:MAG: hypothetical protein AAFU53_05915 [Cyanobacteria bacterium J06632_3]